MTIVRAIVSAFACFSAIPMPNLPWDERNLRYLLAALPLVGVAVGGVLRVWALACDALGAGSMLRAAGLAVLPLVVTGGIHMDGLADVVDAVCSHGNPARKRQILKDPHVGTFAVLGIACYLLTYFALATELPSRLMPAACLAPVLSRCVAALAALVRRPASGTGMLASIAGAAGRRASVALLVAELAGAVVGMAAAGAAAAGTIVAGVAVAAVALVAAALVCAWVAHLAQREFGGLSGDFVGCIIQTSELAMLAAIVCAERLV